jgi:MFS family permease
VSATFIVAIVEKLPLLAGRGGWVWVIVGLAATPSSFLWDRVAVRLGQIGALALAFVLQIVSIVLPAVSDGAAANLLSAVLYGSTFVGIVSLTLSLVGRCYPANPAKAMARLTLSYGVAQIVAPAMAGYIAAATGSYRGALVVAAWAMAAGVLLLYALARQQRAEEAARIG